MVLYFDMTRTKRNHAKPRERFERSTPGLQDQCSNPWANEAFDDWRGINRIKQTQKQYSSEFTIKNQGIGDRRIFPVTTQNS